MREKGTWRPKRQSAFPLPARMPGQDSFQYELKCQPFMQTVSSNRLYIDCCYIFMKHCNFRSVQARTYPVTISFPVCHVCPSFSTQISCMVPLFEIAYTLPAPLALILEDGRMSLKMLGLLRVIVYPATYVLTGY